MKIPAEGFPELSEDEEPRPLVAPDLGGFELTPAKKFNEPEAKFKLTGWILALTSFFTVGFSVLLTVLDDSTWERLQSQLGFLLTPFHTLLGIAIGYYFADKRRDHE